MNISFFSLTKIFPKDTMWVDGCAEIIGYSPCTNMHIVISDGQCSSDDGMYVVHIYKPIDPEEHLAKWNSDKYPYKYLSNDSKIFEGFVDFKNNKFVDVFKPMSNENGMKTTSFHGNAFHSTTNKLIDLFGKPSFYDPNNYDDKTTREWSLETGDGIPFYIYDWKEYREYDDDEIIEFHIGTTNKSASEKIAEMITIMLKQ